MTTFIFDLDGTLYLDEVLLPGARDTLLRLRAAGHLVRFASNNTTLTHQAMLQKLKHLGMDIEPGELTTAPRCTAAYLLSHHLMSALVLGPVALHEELSAEGLSVCSDVAQRVDAVVVGRDEAFSYEHLRMAQNAVFAGAHLIAADGDHHVPHLGELRPGTATLTAALETACATTATIIGKPNPDMLRAVITSAGAVPATTIMVGDSVVTDITAAALCGLYSVYVLSGIAQIRPEPLTYTPSLTLPSVATLIPALRRVRPDLLNTFNA